MSEREFLILLLSCTPRELLEHRVNGTGEIPQFLNNIPLDVVAEALKHYDAEPYKTRREDIESLPPVENGASA